MLLLDTHSFVWLASDQTQLTRDGLTAIAAAAGELYVSSATAWELGLLSKRQRLILPCEAEDFYETAIRQHGVQEVPIDHTIALLSTRLPDIHNDPFDRAIIATAITRGLRLLTKDSYIPKYPSIRTLW